MMRTALTLLVLTVLVGATPAASAEVDFSNDDNKALYALGQLLSIRISELELTAAELKVVEAGLEDGVLGRDPQIKLADHQEKIDAFFKARYDAMVERTKVAGQSFIDEAAAHPGAVKTPSGMVFVETEPGTGESPDATDTVKLHYHGTLMDGTVFDSSRQRGEPASFRLDQVIPCFSEGLQKMKVGGKATLYCPSDLAYGDEGRPPKIPGASPLVFEIDFLEIAAKSD